MVYYKDEKLSIRSMVPEDAKVYYDTYMSYGWHPQIETYENYYKEQENGERIVFVAEYEGKVSGIWSSPEDLCKAWLYTRRQRSMVSGKAVGSVCSMRK